MNDEMVLEAWVYTREGNWRISSIYWMKSSIMCVSELRHTYIFKFSDGWAYRAGSELVKVSSKEAAMLAAIMLE